MGKKYKRQFRRQPARTVREIKPSNQLLAVLLFSFFIVFALGTVLVLEFLKGRQGKPSLFFKETKKPAVAARVNHSEDFNRQLLLLVKKYNATFDYFKDLDNRHHMTIELDAKVWDSFLKSLGNLVLVQSGRLEFSEEILLPQKNLILYNVYFGEDISHFLHLIHNEPGPVEAKKEQPFPAQGAPRIAFIIDDIGYHADMVRELKKLGIPVTGSILPDSPYAQEEARQLESCKLEQMIHIPMQARNERLYYSEKYIGVDSTVEEIEAMFSRAVQLLPRARGCNNHMGSLVTANRPMMAKVLNIVKKFNLFFVDSKTTSASEAYDLAQKMGIKTIQRDVFLDDLNGTISYSYAIRQIRHLAEIAMQKGKALAIGHPVPSTFRALRDSVPYLKSKNLRIVFASELLE